MAMQKVFCPFCGQETQVNPERPFSFCTECGNKIVLQQPEPQTAAPVQNEQNVQSEVKENNIEENDELSAKLEEVAFYYKLSFEKKEYENTEENPTYYLKAQDMLIDLSSEYPNDYRIWWELCKPVDYMASTLGGDIYNRYKINEDYFDKALDRAGLSQKRTLVDEHDKYIKNKEESMQLAQKKREEAEQARAEKQRLQAEEEQKRIAEEQKRIEEEKAKARQEKIEKENMLIAEHENNLENSKPLWSALANKDYSKINNTYFEIEQGNKKIIAVFKLISNMLYLNAYRIDSNKGNAVYQDQGFALKFNDEGYGVKFDNKPVVIKGFMPPNNVLRIAESSDGTMYINDMELSGNTEYITSVMKSAKKPFMSSFKIFS